MVRSSNAEFFVPKNRLTLIMEDICMVIRGHRRYTGETQADYRERVKREDRYLCKVRFKKASREYLEGFIAAAGLIILSAMSCTFLLFI